MSWAAGDLARYVGMGNDKFMPPGMVAAITEARKRPFCIVSGVFIHSSGATGLHIQGIDITPYEGWRASAFRRIHPHATDAEDAETIRLYRGEPVREGV